MESSQPTEQRKFRRQPLKVRLKLTPLSIEADGIKERRSFPAFEVDTDDISAGGAKMKITNDIEGITFMLIEGRDEQHLSPFYVLGHRRWSNDTVTGEVGVSFLTKNQMAHIFAGRNTEGLPADVFQFSEKRQAELDRLINSPDQGLD